jgi:hypothetical protein
MRRESALIPESDLPLIVKTTHVRAVRLMAYRARSPENEIRAYAEKSPSKIIPP